MPGTFGGTITLEPYPGSWMPDVVPYAVALAVITQRDVRLIWNEHEIVVDAGTSPAEALARLARDVGAPLP